MNRPIDAPAEAEWLPADIAVPTAATACLPEPAPAAKALAVALDRLSRWLVPAVCLACRTPLGSHDSLCGACWQRVAFIRPPLCDRLGLPMPFDTGDLMVSAAAAADPPPYARARAVAHYDGVIRTLIQGMKYADRHDPRRLFARWLATAGGDLLRDADLIVPVPLGRWRLLTRRFNQAAIVAGELARMSGKPHDPLALVRTRTITSQVGLTRDQRRRNVAGAFAVPERRRSLVAGKRVLLVDDVITTGATIEACTRALERAGATEVDVLALALVTEKVRASV